MNIFNSLGSNYTFVSALRVLFSVGSTGARQRLIDLLDTRYGGKTFLTYKGREALGLALDAIGAPGSGVAINGFTCFAVYEAVVKSGYVPRYLDITETSLNFSADTLRAALDKNPDIKVAIIQNTLGFPCEIGAIAQLCKERGVVLIEDLAHSVGTRYDSGEEVGTMGDLTMLSFSQDKIVDAISGGALVVRNAAYQSHISVARTPVTFSQQMKNRLYLLITVIIRMTYPIGLGKGIQALLRSFYKMQPATQSSQKKKQARELPDALCRRTLEVLIGLEKDIAHRREIAAIYTRELEQALVLAEACAAIPHATVLRFPVRVRNREGLIATLKKIGVDIHDTWYDAPVAPKKVLPLTSYAGECPTAEKMAEHIANLPTHRHVSKADALAIAKAVNEWHHMAI